MIRVGGQGYALVVMMDIMDIHMCFTLIFSASWCAISRFMGVNVYFTSVPIMHIYDDDDDDDDVDASFFALWYYGMWITLQWCRPTPLERDWAVFVNTLEPTGVSHHFLGSLCHGLEGSCLSLDIKKSIEMTSANKKRNSTLHEKEKKKRRKEY